jgi:hypothetical protein
MLMTSVEPISIICSFLTGPENRRSSIRICRGNRLKRSARASVRKFAAWDNDGVFAVLGESAVNAHGFAPRRAR